MLAHVDPGLILTFWGLLVVSTLAGLLACAGSFLTRSRHLWFLAAASLSITVGIWVAYEAVQDGALRHWSWFTLLAFAPLFFGFVTLIRWKFLNA